MKCIIELEPFTFDEDIFPVLWQAKGFRTLFFDNYGVGKLTPLPDDSCIEHLQKSGWMKDHDKVIYEQGYGDGLNVMKNTDGAELYGKGLHDAWSAARKIICPKSTDEWEKMGKALNAIPEKAFWAILEKEPQEVIRMLDDLESQQAIKIGDEVKLSYNSPDMEPLVVTALMPNSDKDLLCITVRGKYIAVQSKQVVKTGRHFDQVSKLLEAMKENNG